MIDNIKVGNVITELRKKQGLTQRGLAEKLGVSDKAISKWERGTGLPDVSLLSTLSMILGTDIESLLGGHITYRKNNWVGLIDLTNSKLNVSTLIYDKKIMTYQLGYFMLAGINDIYVLNNKKIEINIIEKIVKDINININYIDDIFSVSNNNVMYINKPLFIYGQNLTRTFQKSMERIDGVTILSLPEYVDDTSIIFDSNHKVVDSVDESMETAYKHNALPIIFYPKNNYKDMIKGDLVDIIETLRNKKLLFTETIFRGIIYNPLNSIEDVKDVENLVKIVQKRDYPIGDLKEIERRRGLK